MFAEIFVGAVAEDGHDHALLAAARAVPCAIGQRRDDIAAGRDADQQAFFARQTLDHRVGVFGFDPELRSASLSS